MNNNDTKTIATNFETVTCSRCGGCGEYSYCQMYGTTCFKCGGSGKVYTARGKAAKQFYLDSLTIPVSQLKVGDLYYIAPGPLNKGGFSTVEAIEFNPVGSRQNGVKQADGSWAWECYPEYVIETKSCTYGGVEPTAMVRKGHTAEFKAARKAEALAYQATLTKQGKARKGK